MKNGDEAISMRYFHFFKGLIFVWVLFRIGLVINLIIQIDFSQWQYYLASIAILVVYIIVLICDAIAIKGIYQMCWYGIVALYIDFALVTISSVLLVVFLDGEYYSLISLLIVFVCHIIYFQKRRKLFIPVPKGSSLSLLNTEKYGPAIYETQKSNINQDVTYNNSDNDISQSEQVCSTGDDQSDSKDASHQNPITEEIQNDMNQDTGNQVPPILFCRKCGAKILPNSVYCNKCGEKVLF